MYEIKRDRMYNNQYFFDEVIKYVVAVNVLSEFKY